MACTCIHHAAARELLPVAHRSTRVPLQLLAAYHVAILRGTDVDQPRNLAKSVTVEVAASLSPGRVSRSVRMPSFQACSICADTVFPSGFVMNVASLSLFPHLDC